MHPGSNQGVQQIAVDRGRRANFRRLCGPERRVFEQRFRLEGDGGLRVPSLVELTVKVWFMISLPLFQIFGFVPGESS
ncbi:hypothetical protein YC2023_100682 [Brassica napus]